MGLALHVTDLTVTTARGQKVLRVDDLRVAPGGLTVVAGPSGAGKTTLLHVCAGLLRPATGSVTWGATELSALNDRAASTFRRTQIGIVFQEPLLFEELDALGNAALATAYAPRAERPALRHQAGAALTRLGLSGRAQDDVSRMSGGERQRIAMARALAAAPQIVLADEPTAALDRAAADRLGETLQTLAHRDGRTVLVASHDSGLHARADRLLRIEDGVLLPC